MGPTGIEPVPLVLQTSVRTSYTKGPSERYYQLYYRTSYGPDGTRTHTSPLSGTLWNRTTRFLGQRFYRPLITPVTEASQFLYLVVESNYCHFHVKEIRSHYANEAGATPNHN